MIDFNNEVKMDQIEDLQSAFNYCVQGVEDNNHIHGGSWSDWTDADHISSVYLDTEFYDRDNKQLIDEIRESELLRRMLSVHLEASKKKLEKAS